MSRLGDSGLTRVLSLAAVVGLHLACYWVVTRVTLARGPAVLVDTTLPLDRLIPHLPSTWPFYWIAYPFVLLGGGTAMLRLPRPAYRRAVVALVAMTLVGAAVQIGIPAQAPWPQMPAPSQLRFHASAWILPYATLPSMHVAYCLMVAVMIGTVWHRRAAHIAAGLVVALVAVSTLTLKEHVVLDALSGTGLGALSAVWWRRGAR